MAKTYSVEIGGRDLHFETGHLAQQASGSVLVRYGENAVLVTAVMSDSPREGIDFLPLTVDYMERAYAAGRVPGGFFRREIGRPSEKETLTSRFIDRPMRPLFPKGTVNEIQLIATVLSGDLEIDPDIVALNGAAAALEISDIPFNGPVAAVRMGRIEGKLAVSPTIRDLEHSDVSLMVAATPESIVTLEGRAPAVAEDPLVWAMLTAHESLRPIFEMQAQLRKLAGKPKREFTPKAIDPELLAAVKTHIGDGIEKAPER